MAGLGRLGRLLDRAEARRRVVVGDHEQQRRDHEADQRAQVEVADAGSGAAADAREVVHHRRGDRVEGDRRDDAGDGHALVERALDVAGLRLDREGPDDRGDDRDAAEDERVERDLGLVLRREGEDAEQHHGHRGDRVGLEQVGRHAGAVADVVAHVVGDHGRVARVVLGDAGLDLADDVRADVGALGEDAAAESGEDGDQRAAEAEADQRVDGILGADAEDEGQGAEVAGHAGQRQADHEHAGDGAAAERDVERRADAAARRLGDPCVGPHGDVHADEAGRRRGEAADREADRDLDVLERDQRDEQHNTDDPDHRVLALQIGGGALLDGEGQAAHGLVAGRQREQGAAGHCAVDDRGGRADERDDDPVVGQEVGQGEPLWVRSKAKGDSQTWPSPERGSLPRGAARTPTAPEPRACRSSARGPCRRARAWPARPRAPGRPSAGRRTSAAATARP